MDKRRKQIVKDNQISRVESVNLGGYDQKILIEGKSADFPVVIALHGGPGNPIPFNVGCRGLFPEITSRCIFVCWDQYGCGINRAPLPENITIADFVRMTSDLILYIRKLFPDNKIYLFGMSWGSILSLKAALLCAPYLSGVFTYGQVSWQVMQSEEMLTAILESSAPDKVKAEIKRIVSSEDFTYENMMKISQGVRKYTEGYHNKQDFKAPMGKLIKGLLTGPDYKLRDIAAMFVNGYIKNRSLVFELSRIDLREDFSKINVPYHILQGDTDIVTSTGQIQAIVEKCGNPYLCCRVIENAAHMPGGNGMKAILDEIFSL